MLVCPQCQFENPTANKFCQQCGTSLTHNTCPACGHLVEFDQVDCGVCGAIAGVIWWVVVNSPQPSEQEIRSETPIAIGLNGYLDLQQRYQLLHPLSPANVWGERQGQVLDCQPFQLSLLEVLVLGKPDGMGNLDDPLEADAVASMEGWSDSMAALAVPAIAQPYIALSNQFYHAIPAIHNAWEWNGQPIILLEDRSALPCLTDLWMDQQTAVPLLQVLQWFYEMVDLWEAMEEWNCQQSLVMLSNLRVEPEDFTFCLQRLYPTSTNTTLTWQDLGRTWKALLAESQSTCIEAMTQLLADVEEKQLTTADAIRARIEAIAQMLQPDPPIPVSEAEIDLNWEAALNLPVPDADTDPLTATDADITTDLGTADMSIANLATRLEPPIPKTTPYPDNSSVDADEIPTIVLPMQLFSLEEAGRTDVGRQREHNEDYFGIETQIIKLESPSGKTLHARNLYILCDGMGGHAGGEVASALAVDTLRQFFQEQWQHHTFPPPERGQLPAASILLDAVQAANQAIYDVNQQNARSGSGRMGTTLVMLLIQDTEVAVAHVGDSRLYRYTRKRGLEQVTVDHEVGQREIQRGVDPEVAYSRPDAYQLTQALGPRDGNFVKPDVQFFELNEDMLLLLCSDGLSDNDLLEKYWETHVQPLLSSQTNLDKGVSELIDLANRYNGHDNISAIAIRAKVRPSLEQLK
jgi:protein phosphatase